MEMTDLSHRDFLCAARAKEICRQAAHGERGK